MHFTCEGSHSFLLQYMTYTSRSHCDVRLFFPSESISVMGFALALTEHVMLPINASYYTRGLTGHA